jgi:uncharacterized protein YheU (UPF0270 family)
MIKIPLDSISPDALAGIIEDYITREGTDYGHHAYSFTDKCSQVMAALTSGKAVITFDPVTATTTIVEASDTP